MLLYLIWSLLPLLFFGLALWSVAKPIFGVQGKEDTKGYLVQGLFCAVALGIAIVIDRSESYEALIETISFGMLDFAVARWLLYPGIMLLLAYIQKFVRGENAARTLPKKFIYN